MGPEFFESIMTFMLPIIMSVFQNRTEIEYQNKFQKPCEFNDMLNMFSTLPPYFNEIGRLYPNKTDLIAYYSMQLSSTFLVNKGSLTMDCLYNMLDLQSRLGQFAVGILDRPGDYIKDVGMFGLYMKEHAAPLRENAMLKILEYVDKYEKNNKKEQTVALFNTFNVIFVIISLIGIVLNFIVILVLKRAGYRNIKKRGNNKVIGTTISSHNESELDDDTNSDSSTDAESNTNLHFNYLKLSKRYRTRICLILISICHLFYLKINFIIMSQFKLAEVALSKLNAYQFGCKVSFFLFPPTTPYNILHQYAVWLLVYALYRHNKKIRILKNKSIDVDEFLLPEKEHSMRHISKNKHAHNYNTRATSRPSNKSSICCCFEESGKNIFNCIIIFMLIIIYNAQNLFFYSINKVTIQKTNQTLEFCAFEPLYSNYYVLINQHIVPMLNLFLFVFLPMLLGIIYLIVDLCLFIRLKREHNKMFQHLKEFHIEWLVYVYFIVFFISQMPLFIHQLVDIATRNIKFPFVFPLFIALIFSTKVGLVIFEMSIICLSYSISFLLWLIFDKEFLNIIKFYFNKYILCRTFKFNSASGSTLEKLEFRNNIKTTRVQEMPTSSLIYQKHGKKNQDVEEDEQHQFSTSTTSTNDEKIDVIEKYKEDNFKMIDMDEDKDQNLYQMPNSNYKSMMSGGGGGGYSAITSPPKLINVSNNSDPNYENTENLIRMNRPS